MLVDESSGNQIKDFPTETLLIISSTNITTTSKLHPNYEQTTSKLWANYIQSNRKYIQTMSKVYPYYKQCTSKLQGTSTDKI